MHILDLRSASFSILVLHTRLLPPKTIVSLVLQAIYTHSGIGLVFMERASSAGYRRGCLIMNGGPTRVWSFCGMSGLDHFLINSLSYNSFYFPKDPIADLQLRSEIQASAQLIIFLWRINTHCRLISSSARCGEPWATDLLQFSRLHDKLWWWFQGGGFMFGSIPNCNVLVSGTSCLPVPWIYLEGSICRLRLCFNSWISWSLTVCKWNF